MKCLETRQRNGMKYRRYKTDDDRTVSTYELPVSVLKSIGMARLKDGIARWKRGEERRARAAHVRKEVLGKPDWKPAAIAHSLGITEQRVNQIRKEQHERQTSR